MEYPATLFVTEEKSFYGFNHLVGSGDLENRVREEKETEVAVYRLVGVETYKKTVKIETVVEKTS